jgi:hypothetical protein
MIKRTIFIIFQISVIIITILIYDMFTSDIPPTRISEIIEESLIKNRSFLIKRELYVETIIKKEETGVFWGTDKKALIIAKGKVPYGINLEYLNRNHIQVDTVDRVISIHLRAPEIYDIIISDISFYDIQTGIFINESNYLKSLQNTIFNEAKSTIRSQAELRLETEIDRQIIDELLFFISDIMDTEDYRVELVFIEPKSDTSDTPQLLDN